MRKQITGYYNARNFNAEVGDRVLHLYDGKVFDLQESSGKNQRDAGELYPREVRPPKAGARAVRINDVWFWEWGVRDGD